jgi:hypothetical protein
MAVLTAATCDTAQLAHFTAVHNATGTLSTVGKQQAAGIQFCAGAGNLGHGSGMVQAVLCFGMYGLYVLG